MSIFTICKQHIMAIKITDLVDQQAMQQLTDLATKFDEIKAKYVQIATELIAGINIKVTVVGDLERLDTLVRTTSRQLIDTSKQMTAAVEEQQQALKRTTATIAEQLQKNAQYNAGIRETIKIDEQALDIARSLLGSYDERLSAYSKLVKDEKEYRASLSDLNKQLKDGKVTNQDYTDKLETLQRKLRQVSADKKELSKTLSAEERMNASVAGSYDELRNRLELYKYALKQVPKDEAEWGDMSTEQKQKIQQLRAAVSELVNELKYQGELMGEHQMNVGNYSSAMDGAAVNVKEVSRYLEEYRVATDNGIASTDDITRVLGIEATTTEQLIAQNKALTTAIGQVDQTQAGAKDTIDAMNAKIVENKMKILDVDGVMASHATTIEEAKAQNKALIEAQKLLNLNTDEGKAKYTEYGQRIAENRRFLAEHTQGIASDDDASKKYLVTMENVAAALAHQATSIAEAKEQNKLLDAAIQQIDFTADDAQSRLEQYRAKIEENKIAIANFTGEVRDNSGATNEQQSAIDAANAALSTQVTSIAEAEAQNKILAAAIKEVNITEDDAIEKITQYRAKIEENEATISKFNGKLIENEQLFRSAENALQTDAQSASEAAKQNEILAEAINKVNKHADGAKEKINQYNAKIKENERVIQSNQKASEGMVSTMAQMLGINTRFGTSMQSLATSAANGGNVITGLTTKVKAFGTTLTGLLANPYVLAFLGIAGVVAGFKWWYDYNKGLVEASRLTKYFTGLTGDSMKSVRDHVQAVADTFGKEFTPTLKAANAIAKNMGVSVDYAVDLIAKGLAAGGNNSEQYLSNLERYAPTFQKMGMSAEEAVAEMARLDSAGVNSSRALTAMSKASLQLRTMNLGTSDSLKAIGINATQMTKDIQTGSKTTTQALSEIAEKVKETGSHSREAAAVMKNLFGARGESAIGEGFLDFLANANTSMEELLGKEDSFQRLKLQEVEVNKELEDVVASLFDMTGGGFESATTKCKIWIKQGLIVAIKWIVDIINYFIDLYNESTMFRGAIESLIAYWKLLWQVIKLACNLIIDAVKAIGRSFKGLGTIMEGVMTFSPELIKKGLNEMLDNFKATWGEIGADIAQFGRDTAQGYVDAFNNTVKRNHINRIDVNSISGADVGADGGGVSTTPVDDPTTPKAKGGKTKKDNSAEKQRQAELKAEEATLEAMLELETNYHKKELIKIELQYTKKINAIKGNSEKEQQARQTLLNAMNHALSECEYNYQVKLYETNTANRLAIAKEGSLEEYRIKQEQLDKQHEAELREAERTDADVNLINAKYIKQSAELLEEYEKKRLAKMAETAATEQVIRDNSLKMELDNLRELEAKELQMAGSNEEKIADIKEKYANLTAETQERYAIESAKKQLEAYKQQINALFKSETAFDSFFDDLQDIDASTILLEGIGLAHDDALNLAKSLASAELDIDNAVTDAKLANIGRVTDASKKASEKRIANAEKWLDAAADACSNITDLVSTLFDGQIQKIEEEEEANQQKYDAEIAAIDMMAEKGQITEDEAAIRKRAIEEENAKKEEELAKRKAKLQYKQAVAEKANSIAQIGIATALGIMKAAPNWVNMALVAAMGAIQLATAIAQPIKAYKEGTDYHPGGLAVVGDGGKREVVESKGKYWITPKVPTLVNMPEGSKVFPDFLEFIANEPRPNYGDILAALPLPDITPLLYASTQPQVIVNNDYRALQRDIREQSQILKAMIKQDRRLAAKAKYDRYRAERI